MACGIICAMDQEIALLKEDLVDAKETIIAKRHFFEGTLYGNQVVLVQSHVGKVAAALTTTILLQHFHVAYVLCSGTAGAIDPNLRVGDAVIADFCVQHDFKLPPEWGPKFRIPDLDLSYIPTSPLLTETAKESVYHYMKQLMFLDIPASYQEQFEMKDPKVVIATIASADEFVYTDERRQFLLENVENLGCVEMESAAIAQVCYEFDAPYIIVRIISDCANSSVDFDTFIEHAAKYYTRGVVQAILRAKSF